MIYFVLSLIDKDFAYTWYSPFFGSIAAVYSMQSNRSKSFALARVRALGSLVGGLFGMLLIVLYESYLMDFIVLNYGSVINMLVLFILTAVFIIVMIYLLVRFNVFDLVWVAALTYLSVTISTRKIFLLYRLRLTYHFNHHWCDRSYWSKTSSFQDIRTSIFCLSAD
jgi:hypothetical protein